MSLCKMYNVRTVVQRCNKPIIHITHIILLKISNPRYRKKKKRSVADLHLQNTQTQILLGKSTIQFPILKPKRTKRKTKKLKKKIGKRLEKAKKGHKQ